LTSTTTVSVEQIHVPENVRRLDAEHVKALAASIALQGMLVPIVVRHAADDSDASGCESELVAGFHRTAAAAELGLAEVPAVIRDGDQEASDRAIENIARKQLDAQEEAVAVKAMLDRGLSEDGAAQALGWPKARVTARIKLLELPEQAQQLAGEGVIRSRPSTSCGRSARSARSCSTCWSTTWPARTEAGSPGSSPATPGTR
jgi:ParB/RepB/Spo0J family partition protein